MNDELKKQLIQTGVVLNLTDKQFTLLNILVNLAYNQGRLDERREHVNK